MRFGPWELLFILNWIVPLVIVFILGYFVVKKAVKKGMSEYYKENNINKNENSNPDKK